jgi:hypothetical protein
MSYFGFTTLWSIAYSSWYRTVGSGWDYTLFAEIHGPSILLNSYGS